LGGLNRNEVDEVSTLPVKQVVKFFRSYGLKYETELVEEWMSTDPFLPKAESVSHQISEEYMHRFNDWLRWKGTAYEVGIDNETKINRLLEEINSLREQVERLQREKAELEDQSGILPF
jgi:predicted ribosome quality control (RQC) complex YloA/Tae2 family protein